MFQRMSPLRPETADAELSAIPSLLEGKQTLIGHPETAVLDPERSSRSPRRVVSPGRDYTLVAELELRPHGTSQVGCEILACDR